MQSLLYILKSFKIYIIQHGCMVFLHEIHASSVSP
nr:MAG TPA: hypothetical protein [Caudoviricetes sp.]